MSTNVSVQTQVQTVQDRILALLDELPPESLTRVERFVQLLREQARQGQPTKSVQEERTPYIYPTVATPPSSLDGWLDLVPEGYEGDALADTEALYDEV